MKKIPLLFALAALGAAAHAQVNAYSNVTTFTGQGYAGGGAAATAGVNYTNMVADDINFAAGAGGRPITAFSFSVANFNATAVTASALVRFYSANPTTGGPATLLSALNFNPIAFGASSVQVYTATSATGFFTSPTNGSIWAGIVFSDTVAAGTTAPTVAQLNNLGQGIFNPPTIGTSVDAFFQSTTPSSALTSNPTGSFFSFGGSPVANFGWSFTTTNPVPEPSAFAALGLGAVTLLRRRRRA